MFIGRSLLTYCFIFLISSFTFSCSDDSQYELHINTEPSKLISDDTFKNRVLSYTKKCDKGKLKYCENLADLYLKHRYFSNHKDDSKCKKDDFVNCMHFFISPSNHKISAILYKKTCDAGLSDGCNKLGNLYFDGVGVKKNRVEAFRLFRIACEMNNTSACNNVGYMHEIGITGKGGVKRNISIAFVSYQKSCNKEYWRGCYDLARFHYDGQGTKKNKRLAYKLYKTSCEKGESLSCSELGRLAFFSNINKSIDYYKRGCDLKDGYSCHQVAISYRETINGENKPELWAEYFDKACTYKYPEGCMNVAYFYFDGKMVQKSLTRAYSYFKKGCIYANGINNESCIMAHKLYKKI
jgi:uncharacterized protein